MADRRSSYDIFSRIKRQPCRRHLMISKCHWLHSSARSKSARSANGQLCKELSWRLMTSSTTLRPWSDLPPLHHLLTYSHRNPDEPEPTPQEQRQAQILQAQLSPHELAYQESLIQEREAEIREIEQGIHELSEIFHDLGTLVNQQGSMIGMYSCFLRYPMPSSPLALQAPLTRSQNTCHNRGVFLDDSLFSSLPFVLGSDRFSFVDNIELNISSVSADTGAASQELTTAAEYQRKAGKRAACLMLILAVVAAVVLLAVSADSNFLTCFKYPSSFDEKDISSLVAIHTLMAQFYRSFLDDTPWKLFLLYPGHDVLLRLTYAATLIHFRSQGWILCPNLFPPL